MTTEELLPRLAAIVFLGVGAQWLAWRVRAPSILLLLVIGVIAGPVTGYLEPDEMFGGLLAPAVSLSVAIILFEGGLSLRWTELRGVAGVVRNLISVGAAVTGLSAAAFAYYVLDLDLSLAVLLGAILVVTGPTVVVPLLEQIRPLGQVKTILKWEGIVIDPLGAMVAVLAFEAILSGELDEATAESAVAVVKTLGVGTGIGVAVAGVLVLLLRRYLIPDQLQNPVTLMAVVTATAAANWVQTESGLLAATVMGVAVANQRAVSVKHLLQFKESLRVLLIGSLFIVLSARLEADDLRGFGGLEVALLAMLILFARPLGVAVSTAGSPLTWKERLFLALMAPRGIVAASVASIFALRLAEEGYPQAERLLSLTFFVIVGTIAVYGLLGPVLARRLGLAKPKPQGALIVSAHPWARSIGLALQNAGVRVVLVDTNRENVGAARQAGLTAHFSNALSEELSEEVDLDDIGKLVALTPNDEVNSLASQQFAELFGRAEVYQLAAKGDLSNKGKSARDRIPQHLRGRILFSPDLTFDMIEQEVAAGATVKATTISDEFTYEDFLSQYGGEAFPLFLITPAGGLTVVTADGASPPKSGQTLVALVHSAKEQALRLATLASTGQREP